MNERDNAWIVIDYALQPATQVCQRCKETAPMPFNCAIDYAIAAMQDFLDIHSECEPEMGTGVL